MTWKLEDNSNAQIEIIQFSNNEKVRISLLNFVTDHSVNFYPDKLQVYSLITELQKIALELK